MKYFSRTSFPPLDDWEATGARERMIMQGQAAVAASCSLRPPRLSLPRLTPDSHPPTFVQAPPLPLPREPVSHFPVCPSSSSRFRSARRELDPLSRLTPISARSLLVLLLPTLLYSQAVPPRPPQSSSQPRRLPIPRTPGPCRLDSTRLTSSSLENPTMKCITLALLVLSVFSSATLSAARVSHSLRSDGALVRPRQFGFGRSTSSRLSTPLFIFLPEDFVWSGMVPELVNLGPPRALATGPSLLKIAPSYSSARADRSRLIFSLSCLAQTVATEAAGSAEAGDATEAEEEEATTAEEEETTTTVVPLLLPIRRALPLLRRRARPLVRSSRSFVPGHCSPRLTLDSSELLQPQVRAITSLFFFFLFSVRAADLDPSADLRQRLPRVSADPCPLFLLASDSRVSDAHLILALKLAPVTATTTTQTGTTARPCFLSRARWGTRG